MGANAQVTEARSTFGTFAGVTPLPSFGIIQNVDNQGGKLVGTEPGQLLATLDTAVRRHGTFEHRGPEAKRRVLLTGRAWFLVDEYSGLTGRKGTTVVSVTSALWFCVASHTGNTTDTQLYPRHQ